MFARSRPESRWTVSVDALPPAVGPEATTTTRAFTLVTAGFITTATGRAACKPAPRAPPASSSPRRFRRHSPEPAQPPPPHAHPPRLRLTSRTKEHRHRPQPASPPREHQPDPGGNQHLELPHPSSRTTFHALRRKHALRRHSIPVSSAAAIEQPSPSTTDSQLQPGRASASPPRRPWTSPQPGAFPRARHARSHPYATRSARWR